MGRSTLSVALIGSSGGGSATLTSQAILENLQKEFESIEGATVNLVSWILCRSESGFDFATNETPTSLLASTTCRNDIVDGNLNEINRMAQLEDAQLAGLIRSGRIDALVSISADPEGVNKASTSAAIAKQIPIVGTGGTSISALSLSGAHVIGSSGGSVSTTAISKSICFASSLASYWNLLYKRRRPSFLSIKLQSILGAALPMLLAVNIFKLLLPMSIEWCMSFTADSFIYGDTNIQSLLMSGINIILPITLSVISCSEVSRLGELSMICGAAAGAMYSVVVITLRNSDQLLVSIINGAICGYTLESFLIICASYSILPTATTIIAMGLSSIISGSISILLSAYVLPYWYSSSVVTMIFTLYNNFILQFVLKSSARRRLFGAFLGYMVSWGSENGYYHSIMLPIIAFQMQGGEFSSAGAFDLVCLCLPCAGVCLAIFLLALTNSCKLKNREFSAIDMGKQRNMGWKGFISNCLVILSKHAIPTL